MMSHTRVIPILSALKLSSKITPFVPYMLDTHLQTEKYFPELQKISCSEYDLNAFAVDNKLVLSWFSDLRKRFYFTQNTAAILEATGSRSFGASYTESDLECAIVSENFQDFLDFSRFLHANYHHGHNFIALKTQAGLPLLIIKGANGFSCPELSRIYADKALPQLEVTFRHPRVHALIQKAGQDFFAGLNPDELQSYVFNKRYIELMLRNLPKDVSVDGKPLKAVLEEFKGALSEALKCLPPGQLQDTPNFNKDVFAEVVQPRQALIEARNISLFNSQENIKKQNQKWLAQLSEETSAHCAYLESIGLADRANYFKVKSFIYQDTPAGSVDISRFSQTMGMPEIVTTFDTQETNTLFANPESTQEQEIERTLDIRLYPPIRRLITKNGASVFLGSKSELQAYAASNKERIIIEIETPSSVKFYLTDNESVYISGLVSHENLIQQLMTLKLANINLNSIKILGNTQQFKLVCKNDLSEFGKLADLAKRNVLIVAGCTLEGMACDTLEQMLEGNVTKRKFSGELVSLTYVQSSHVPNLGFIVLNLNYGEICEEQIAFILQKFNCVGVFSGSAAGYIPAGTAKSPEIGTRIPVNCAKHYSGETITLGKENQSLHLHVPTIFVETFNWLKKASGASTVDVETYYILRAVKAFQASNPQIKLHIDIGIFISDYIGEKPLRSYNKVYTQYPQVLQNFVKQTLIHDMTSIYNNNRLTIPSLSSEFCSLTPKIITISEGMRKEAVVDSIGKLWDKTEFSKRVHTPVTIGAAKDADRFSSVSVERCMHLPIKLPGSDIRIPIEYQHYLNELQQIFDFEASINPGWGELYAYLTVDQGFVARDNSQRVPGPHVDGIPRDRENPGAQLIDHAYLMTNAVPTMFYAQQFDMTAYDPRLHHFFAIFRALADESRTIMPNPFDIILMDAYSVHTPTQTQEDVNRTFIRLEFSTLKFDRIGNSVNPHFSGDESFRDYPFNYIPRPIPEHLFVPPSVFLNKPITNKDYLVKSIDDFGRKNLQVLFTENDRFKLKHSDYVDLNLIAKQMLDLNNQGMIVSYQGKPQAFALYSIENKVIKLHTLFTLESGKGNEVMIYLLKLLNKKANKLSIQAGLGENATPISIVVDNNNEPMLKYFLRAARLAVIDVNIERLERAPQLSLN